MDSLYLIILREWFKLVYLTRNGAIPSVGTRGRGQTMNEKERGCSGPGWGKGGPEPGLFRSLPPFLSPQGVSNPLPVAPRTVVFSLGYTLELPGSLKNPRHANNTPAAADASAPLSVRPRPAGSCSWEHTQGFLLGLPLGQCSAERVGLQSERQGSNPSSTTS